MEGPTCQPQLSVVVISWKMRDLLERMLTSLYRWMPSIDFEVICVDNGSEDGTIDMVTSGFPSVQLIRNPVNLGVAPARNQAITKATGKFIAILDADLEFVEDSLGPILSLLQSMPSVGIAGCRLTFQDGITQHNAKRFPTLFAQLSRRSNFLRWLDGGKQLAHHEMHEWDRSTSREVDYLIGACQVIRKEVFDQVGLLDDSIFYGPEDIDFCLRARQVGWKCWFVHSVRIIHHEQRITKQKPFSMIMRRHLIGLLYFYRKHGLGYASKVAAATKR
jgi:GT2 family glycosyltransferase